MSRRGNIKAGRTKRGHERCPGQRIVYVDGKPRPDGDCTHPINYGRPPAHLCYLHAGRNKGKAQ